MEQKVQINLHHLTFCNLYSQVRVIRYPTNLAMKDHTLHSHDKHWRFSASACIKKVRLQNYSVVKFEERLHDEIDTYADWHSGNSGQTCGLLCCTCIVWSGNFSTSLMENVSALETKLLYCYAVNNARNSALSGNIKFSVQFSRSYQFQ